MTEDISTARRNVRTVTAAQSFGGANPSIVILTGGLVGQHLSSDPAFITAASVHAVGVGQDGSADQ
jgi:hypothetical protein